MISLFTFTRNDGTPKFDAEKMLCCIEVEIFQFAANDVVDGRKHDMVDRSKRSQGLNKGIFITDVSNDTLDMWALEPLGCGVELLARRGDDGDLGTNIQERRGSTKSDTAREDIEIQQFPLSLRHRGTAAD